MSDLRDAFRALEADVAQLRRPSPSEIRHDAERRRRNGRIALAAAGLAITFVGVMTVTQVVDGGSDRITAVATSSSPTPSAAESRGPVGGPWLPPPWHLEHSTAYTWAGGTMSSYRFCGDSMLTHATVAVAEQRLVHPSGLRARLLTLTPEGENPVNLFKFTYASCVTDGSAESIGGPRNVWSYDGAAGAAEVVGGALWLLEVTGQSPEAPPTQRDAESALDTWTASAPRFGPDQPQLVPDGHVVVVRADHTVAHIDRTGTAHELAALPPNIGEPDSIVVDPGGRLVMVSAVKSGDDQPVCAAVTLQLTSDGRWHQVISGASLALSADGRRLAYFAYGFSDGLCRRASLVVRELDTGAENGVVAFDDGPLHGTPPEWPVNWSPDGTRVAHVTDVGAVVTDIARRASTAVRAPAGTRPLAPVWMSDGRLAVLEGCCIGDGSMRDAETAEQIFSVPGPVRSIRAARDGGGAWITVEEGPLLWWDGATLHRIEVDALLASG